MIIINNLELKVNHYSRIKELVSECEEMIIVSPFLMSDFKAFFNDINLDSINHIQVITTLKPKSFDQINKVNSLLTFVELPIFDNENVECKISINNKLHGKIYIFKKLKSPFKAIITSANFTDSGLSYNHEWGIEISNISEIKSIEASIINSIEIDNISKSEIYKLHEIINKYLEEKPNVEIREIDLNLSSYLSSYLPSNLMIHFDDSVNYWLKPIGVTEYPVETDRKFDNKEYDSHFSGRPTGVKINDILVCYGVGTGKVLSVYKAISLPLKASEEDIKKEDWKERWSWYIKCENLTSIYGSKWSTHNLNIGLLAKDYLKQNKDNYILANGSISLGGLNWGKDKLRLSTEFARFIIDKVLSINNVKAYKIHR